MGYTKLVSTRIPVDLLDRVDRHRTAVEAREGVRVSRTEAMIGLLGLALDALDAVGAPEKPGTAATVRERLRRSR